MPKLPPTTIDDEDLALLNKASKAAKASKAEIVRRCIRAHAPYLAATRISPLPAAEISKGFKFDKKKVKEIREARHGDY